MLVVAEDWYVASHRLPLIRAAADANWRVIVSTRVARHRPAIEAAGATVYPSRLARESRNPLNELRALAELVRLYRRHQPLVVHHVGLKPVLYGGIAARLVRVPRVVHAFAGLGSLFGDELSRSRTRTAAIRALRLATGGRNTLMVVQNPYDAELLVANGLVAKDRVTIVPGVGADLGAYSHSHEPSGPMTVLLASRMLREKGIGEFVEVARRLRGRARFVLAGAPDPANPMSITESELRQWAASGVVEWLGHVDDMPRAMRDATIVVLPSYYREGIPKVLLEAAAAGRPVVTTTNPGCRDAVVDGVTGLLVPPRDVEALHDAVGSLLSDPARRQRMGHAGRMLAESRFDEKVLARQLLSAITGETQ